MRCFGHSLFFGLFLILNHSAVADILKPFQASYTLEHKKTKIGKSYFSLRRTENGDYVFQSDARARGLAKLLRSRPLTEISHFSLEGNQVRSKQLFSNEHSRDSELVNNFDWPASIVEVTSEDHGSVKLELESSAIYDRVNVQIAMMLDAKNNSFPKAYALVKDDHVALYHTTIDKHAEIEIDGKVYPAITVVRQRPKSSRKTTTWLAKELHFVPVKMVQTRNGELRSRMTLIDVTFEEAK